MAHNYAPPFDPNPHVDAYGIGGPGYKHRTERYELKRSSGNVVGPIPYPKPSGSQKRIEKWMRWKRVEKLHRTLTEQLGRARKRGSRTTPVKLADLQALLDAVVLPKEPK